MYLYLVTRKMDTVLQIVTYTNLHFPLFNIRYFHKIQVRVKLNKSVRSSLGIECTYKHKNYNMVMQMITLTLKQTHVLYNVKYKHYSNVHNI
jgi:hypothetical protein